jgi:hypothetical protein
MNIGVSEEVAAFVSRHKWKFDNLLGDHAVT